MRQESFVGVTLGKRFTRSTESSKKRDPSFYARISLTVLKIASTTISSVLSCEERDIQEILEVARFLFADNYKKKQSQN
jgi:hypothetical protein